MNTSITQNTSSIKQVKSMVWKISMIFISEFIAVLIVMTPLSLIWFFLFLGRGYSITDLTKMEDIYSLYLFPIVTLLASLLGIRYGVNYVAQKSVVSTNEVAKIIVWFLVINILLRFIYASNSNAISLIFFILTLAINAFAIKFFFQKALR